MDGSGMDEHQPGSLISAKLSVICRMYGVSQLQSIPIHYHLIGRHQNVGNVQQ